MTEAVVAISTLLLITAAVGAAADPKVEIGDRRYRVSWDQTSSEFTVQAGQAGRVVLSHGRLGREGGAARAVAARHPVFGLGRAIEVAYPDGACDTIALYAGAPFVLFTSSRRNGAPAEVTLNHIASVSAQVEGTGGALRTLGTGGLLDAARNPGSYAFLAIADPATRAGVVAGWLTHDRGSGVVLSPVVGDAVRVQGRLDYGRLRLLPGESAALETFVLGWFPDARFGLEAYADAMARMYRIVLPPQPSGLCTWYMDRFAGSSDEGHLAELAKRAASELRPFGFDFVQIDDQWQAGISHDGPNRNFTTHAPGGPYRSGMKAMAEGIQAVGLRPGIWFMPFAGTSYDPFFAGHTDWFSKGPDGKPFETAWGGTCLDMTQPGAREHLRGIVERISREWGYTFFKMDGLWTGTATRQVYVNDGLVDDGIGETTFANPAKTNVEAYRDGLRLVRETAGRGVYLLGCCVSQNMRSLGGAIGLLDGMRIGPDTGGRIGALHGSRLWFLHNRVWHNDPDCVFVRASLPMDEARLNASWAAVSGQLFYDSDWVPDLPADRMEILKRCMPAHGLAARPVDVFEAEPARVWHVSDTRGARRDLVALYNWSGSPATVGCSASRIGLPAAKEYVAFDFWGNRFLPPFANRVTADLPAQACVVLAIRPVSAHPQLISTSRHITQGMVDVLEERWDPARRALSGVSRVVAGDAYELRIVTPDDGRVWRAAALHASGAGAPGEVKQDGSALRAVIRPTETGEVRWAVIFDAPATPAEDRSGASRTGAVALPGLRKLMDSPLRDTSICRGPDGDWYLTGTVEPFWDFNAGIRVWRSPDMQRWEPLGMVWRYGASPWHRKYMEARKPVWAPEIHYMKGTFWLTYSIPGYDGTGRTSGSGLLRSVSGRADGPYEDVQPTERLGDEIDASLFQDDDGTVYFLWHSGKIARMKPDMSGLAEPYHWLRTAGTDANPAHHSGLCAGIFGAGSFDHVGYEGMFLFKRAGIYYLACSDSADGRYSCYVATSRSIYGPYSERYEAIPHAGHNMLFRDGRGQWWSSFFGSEGSAPWQERPGVLPVEFARDGRLRPKVPRG